MGIWNGFDEHDIAIHLEETEAERREVEWERQPELSALETEEHSEPERATRNGDVA